MASPNLATHRLAMGPLATLFLMTLSAVLLCWPFFADGLNRPGVLFAYFFIAWAIVLLLLRMISASVGRRPEGGSSGNV